MLLRVLGPLEVSGPNGGVTIGAAKPRALLAALAIRSGETVSAEVLVDALWGETPPRSASKLVQVYVSQLRKVLPAGIAIGTTATGYQLDVDPPEIDAVRFERLISDGHAAFVAGNPALASSALSRALALWRGPAYADVRYDEFAREEVERLEALRSMALDERIEADLQLGRHDEVLGELRGLLAADPLNERLAAQAMLAAYRSSGAMDPLAIFDSVRISLASELGEEPGPELRELRDRVVSGDPGLDLARTPDLRNAVPSAPNPLIGRERELADLHSLISRPDVRFVSLTGAGGSGKSRLALELAHALEGEFANGALLVELGSLSDPDLVIPTIAQALGLEPGRDAMSTLTAALASRELLLVVDNLEHLRESAPSLVRLLAGAPRLAVVVTSRAVLHVSGEHVYPVGPLAEQDAVALFVDRARANDPAFVLDEATEPRVASICRRLDGLPLPIELAAARARALGLRTLDARLASRLSVLTAGPRDLPARQQTLRETLAWSVNLLEPRVAEVLAALAVFPMGCTLDGGRAVTGATDEDIVTLVDHHLVQVLDSEGEPRYRLLETVREYAYELLESRREEIESALVTWMLGVIEEADLAQDTGALTTGLRRIDADLETLRDALRHASREEDPSRELTLASGAWRYWWIRGLLAEGRAILDGILARRGMVATRAGIGTALAAAGLAWSTGDAHVADELATRALEMAERIDDRLEQLAAHFLLGIVANTSFDDFEVAVRHLTSAIDIAEADGMISRSITAKMSLGSAYLDNGQVDEARRYHSEVLDYRRNEGSVEGVAFARLNLGETEFRAGNIEAAETHFAEALAGFRSVGFAARVANSLQGLAAVEATTGRAESAARRLGSAATLLGETGWAADGTGLAPGATAAAREALGDEAFDRLFREGAAAPSRE
jgi:predicted ATPase/DNA-binding SARP family transcriptional activator